MNNLEISLFIIIIILILNIDIKEQFNSIFLNKKVCSDIDGRCYEISTKYNINTYDDASDQLALVNIKLIAFLRYLRHKYIWNNNFNEYRTNLVKRLLKLYNQDNLIENAPEGLINTSYVENKGKIFALCLREKKTGKYLFQDMDTLFFVALHELSHIANTKWDHGIEFWHDFKIILEEATESGIYIPIDYSKNNVNYCGLNVSYNPFYDNSIITK
jgi:hypothetical protein